MVRPAAPKTGQNPFRIASALRSVIAMNNNQTSSGKSTVRQGVWHRFRNWVHTLADDLTQVQAPCVPEIRSYPNSRGH
jgi:hypothetical protein